MAIAAPQRRLYTQYVRPWELSAWTWVGWREIAVTLKTLSRMPVSLRDDETLQAASLIYKTSCPYPGGHPSLRPPRR